MHIYSSVGNFAVFAIEDFLRHTHSITMPEGKYDPLTSVSVKVIDNDGKSG
jgi:hypothetical protein